MSKIVPLIISTYFDKSKSFLDFGAGYGIFVRMMRDKGFNFFWQDEYCQNIFTKNYGINNNLNGRFELVTAFEVFEHLVNPSLELEKMLKFSDSILFSTNIVPDKDLENWWYLSPETGQHIALYSLKSLQKLGELHQLNFYTNGHNFHLFTKKSINPLIFQILKTIKQLSQFIRPTSAKNAFQIDRENLK
ncbi:MAG: class I SAM-dependent methyltransferase [Cytophagales bacterium]